MKQLLGFFIVSLPFLGLYVWTGITNGFRDASIIFLQVLAISGFILLCTFVGVLLIKGII